MCRPDVVNPYDEWIEVIQEAGVEEEKNPVWAAFEEGARATVEALRKKYVYRNSEPGARLTPPISIPGNSVLVCIPDDEEGEYVAT